ncbi:MAG: hypothetical protein IPN19_12715 [Elusimicrobia bacterium]|nr:hypothetical protein [Elusimicrobiota bacterium]
MESEGPYRVERHALGGVGIVGPNRDGSYTGLDRAQSNERVSYLNEGYAEGRKSAEKDFNELLEIANEAGYFNQDMMIWRMKYADWKKARGIE